MVRLFLSSFRRVILYDLHFVIVLRPHVLQFIDLRTSAPIQRAHLATLVSPPIFSCFFILTLTHHSIMKVTFLSSLLVPLSVAIGGTKAQSENGGSGSAASINYQQYALYSHNLHRYNHSANPLTWDQNQANIAAYVAASCVFAHQMYASFFSISLLQTNAEQGTLWLQLWPEHRIVWPVGHATEFGYLVYH